MKVQSYTMSPLRVLQRAFAFSSRPAVSTLYLSESVFLSEVQQKATNTIASNWNWNTKVVGTQTRGFCTSTVRLSNTEKSDEILIQVSNGVRRITFNRPDKKNAITKYMGREFISAIHAANADEATTVVVLTGSGDYFTSGMDMTSSRPSSEGQEQPKKQKPVPNNAQKDSIRKDKFSSFISTIVDCKKPLIALINGPAIGVGVTMLGLFDAVYASDKATFHTTFTRFGLPPEMGSTYTFPRIMGYGKANHMLVLNNKITAQEAFENGLVSRIFPHEVFHEKTSELVNSFGQLPVKSLIYSKELVRGRERQLLKNVSEKEQSYFDPEIARAIIQKFKARKL